MRKIVALSWFAILLLTVFEVRSNQRSTSQAYAFINSSIPEQYLIFTDFNQQYFFSATLRNTLAVTFIDISDRPRVNSAITPIIHDIEGVWVDKFRPSQIPILYCIKGNRRYQVDLKDSGDIRKCL